MSFWCPVVVTILYVLTASDYIRQRNYPVALVWGAYALANVGLIWSLVSNKE